MALRKFCVLGARRKQWWLATENFPVAPCVRILHDNRLSPKVAAIVLPRCRSWNWRHFSSSPSLPDAAEAAEAAERGLRILRERSDALEQGGPYRQIMMTFEPEQLQSAKINY